MCITLLLIVGYNFNYNVTRSIGCGKAGPREQNKMNSYYMLSDMSIKPTCKTREGFPKILGKVNI